MYGKPTLADLDRNLRQIFERRKQEALLERVKIVSEATLRSAGRSSRAIFSVMLKFKELHERALEDAMHLIQDFAQRSELPISELTAAARAPLESFAEQLLDELPDHGFREEVKRIRDEHRSLFSNAREGALRDIEIGFIGGRSVKTITPTTIQNYIKVDRSTVGAINTGEVDKINVSLTQLHNGGNDAAKDALKNLTDAILAESIPDDQKNELLEHVAFLGEQAALEPAKRNKGVVRTILSSLPKAPGMIAAIANAWQAAEPVLRGLFSA